ncbi:beta-1,6-N-acetylglucosaminyltransferase [Flavobacterium algicola]|uniref:beta-1,6-N-acetylglucosaminyltransferase n=1 Tax=Flavobacterium algicola TaxID=556529 RepID=UPI001EFE3159|nr:beta-1,6-N-acetylglucosaminyltransferase [Flavobacterium algicola]MCG9793898.1 beta-1,6-N-acetylglucosaminyltransferase [Flavobacterium algicola]
MMTSSKQAILITAYKNYEQLEVLINQFDSGFEIFIHIDKKSALSDKQRNHLIGLNNVALVAQKYTVNWGGFNHVKCILYLCQMAIKNPETSHFHLISGADFPIKSTKDFRMFFQDNKTAFIDCFAIPFSGWSKENGGLDRLEYYSPYDSLNSRKIWQKKLLKKVIHWQKKYNIKRSWPAQMPKLYAGSTWWSLERDCVAHIINFVAANWYFSKRFENTFCAEEFFFQTILMNSEFKKRIQSNNLRFIDWNYKNGSNPSILDETDFKNIISSEAFFARKVASPFSDTLVSKLIKRTSGITKV